MTKDLLEIHPDELGFRIEWKKQSFCSMRFVNNSDQYVAYKVKTTSPRKYSVRPNVGIVKPNSESEAIVTMVAPRIAQLDLVCKDKFLVQAIVVPDGTTVADIRSEMFAKEEGKYIEEKKLRVNLISPPLTPEMSTIDVPIKEKPNSDLKSIDEDVVEPQMVNLDKVAEKDTVQQHTENVKDSKLEANSEPNEKLNEEVSEKDIVSQHADNVKDSKLEAYTELSEEVAEKDIVFQLNEDVKDSKLEADSKLNEEAKIVDCEEVTEKAIVLQLEEDIKDAKLENDIKEMKSKLSGLESKLNEIEVTISKLTEERRLNRQERETLRQELAMLKNRTAERKDHKALSLPLVFLVSIIGVLLGYILHQ